MLNFTTQKNLDSILKKQLHKKKDLKFYHGTSMGANSPNRGNGFLKKGGCFLTMVRVWVNCEDTQIE